MGVYQVLFFFRAALSIQKTDNHTCLTPNPATTSCSCPSDTTFTQVIRTKVDAGSEVAAAIYICERGTAKPLNVHAICHTHDDVGWINTYCYFYGFITFASVQGYYDCCVNDIITTVVDSLWENDDRKFTYVEMAFMNMWWEQQTETTQYKVKKLVESGQLDFTM